MNAPKSNAGLQTIRANAGDTITKIAARYGFAATDLAGINGVQLDTPLQAGREIRIPPTRVYSRPLKSKPTVRTANIDVKSDVNRIPQITAYNPKQKAKIVDVNSVESVLLGKKPVQAPNGKVQIVMKWFQDNLNDPYSMRIVSWSKLDKKYSLGEPYWMVTVRLRAKNSFGAYVLNDYTFLIRQNKIVNYFK